MNIILLVLSALSGIIVTNGQLQCRDESGKVVDWYVAYKFPHLTGHSAPLDTGYRYAFITNNSMNGFILSDYNITDGKKSIFGQTLSPLYSTKLDPRISYIDYNDEPPEGSGATTSVNAHAKGVVAADESHGFWLIHSVPHFSSDEVLSQLRGREQIFTSNYYRKPILMNILKLVPVMDRQRFVFPLK